MQLPLIARINVWRGGYRWNEHTDIKYTPEEIAGGADPESPEGRLFLEACDDEASPDDATAVDVFRTYDPFCDEPALFHVFADVEPRAEDIRAFADEYGDLTHHLSDRPLSFGEWKIQITLLNEALHLWQAIVHEDDDAIRKHLAWEKGSVRPGSVIAKDVEWFFRDKRYSRSDLLHAARDLLHQTVICNAELDGNIVPRQSASGALELPIRLLNLADVLWVQFASAVAESKTYRRCEMCRRAFEVAPELNRVDRLFCRDACRVKSFRRRQTKARKMRADGKKLREIVKEVGSDMKTIKKWLGEEK